MIAFLRDYYNRSPDSFYVMISLSGFWFWLHIFIFNFDTSPLSDLLYKTGADMGIAQMIGFISMAVGFCIQVFFFDEAARSKTSTWFSLGWIMGTILLGFITDEIIYYIVMAAMGLFAGLVLARLGLMLIFLLPKKNSARYIIVQFTLTNIPFMILRAQLLGDITLLNYSIIVAIQMISAFTLYKAKPDILKIRSKIPDRTISLKEILLLAVILLGIYFCMGGIQAVARPNFEEVPNIYLFQIIPNVIVIILYFCWIYRVKLIVNMTVFFVLLCLAFVTFQVSGGSAIGRYIFEVFIEAANYFIDVFEFVIFARLMYAFGRRAFRIKIVFAIVTLIIGGVYAVAALFWDTEFTTAQYSMFYIVIVLLLAGVPYFSKALPFLFDEEYQTDSGIQREIDEQFDDLVTDSLAGRQLTEKELEIVSILCRRQDYDVVANILGISGKELQNYCDSIFRKLGVKNKHQLYSKFDPFESYDLTTREKELARLLLTGEPQKNIAPLMGVSYSTVKFHSNNLYKKLNIQSRAELFQLFSGT